MKGHNKANVLACVKHFPGHGATSQDSHKTLPRIEHNMSEMLAIDIPPFAEAIKQNIDLVMVGHLMTPLDDDNPASLSPKTHEFLRKDLGFTGLTISDSMKMEALNQSDYNNSCLRAILAGCDLLCSCDGYMAPIDNYNAVWYIVEQAKSNEALRKRIDESVLRIIQFKLKLKERQKTIDFDANSKKSQSVYDKSIVLRRNSANLLPLNQQSIKDKIKTIYVIECSASDDYMNKKMFDVIDGFDESFITKQLLFTYDPTDEEYQAILSTINESDDTTLFIMAPYKLNSHQRQRDIIDAIKTKTNNYVVASYSDPYETMNDDDLQTIAIAFEISPMAITTLSKAIIGEIGFNGTMPFKI